MMNVDEAIKVACRKPTLEDALTYICVWECEFAIKRAVASNLKGWDTCFKYVITKVLIEFKKKTKKKLKRNT